MQADTAGSNVSTEFETSSGTLRTRLENEVAKQQESNATAKTKQIVAEAASTSLMGGATVLANNGITDATTLANQFQTAQQEKDITASATAAAQRMTTEEFQQSLVAPPPAGTPAGTPNTVAAAAGGIDVVQRGTTTVFRGATRSQASAQASADKLDADEVNARAVLIATAPGVNSTNMIPTAAQVFKDSLANNDSVGARAAIQHLMKTGAPGKMALNQLLQTIPTEPEPAPGVDPVDTEIVSDIKSDLLAAGIKGYDIAIDKWALQSKSKLADVLSDTKSSSSIYATLNPEDLAGQTNLVLNSAAKAGAITSDMANTILTNEQSSRKLTPEQKQFFEFIKDNPIAGLRPYPLKEYELTP